MLILYQFKSVGRNRDIAQIINEHTKVKQLLTQYTENKKPGIEQCARTYGHELRPHLRIF